MSSPILILEGIFVPATSSGDSLVVSRLGDPDADLDEILSEYVGSAVEVSLHHYPESVDKTQPGGGSCLWGGFCPHGHRENPGWLFHQRLTGELSQESSGWSVGGTALGFSKMPGHRGRLVIMDVQALESPAPDASPDDLICEAGDLADLLTELQKVVKP